MVGILFAVWNIVCHGDIDVTKGIHIIASAWCLHDASKMDVDYFGDSGRQVSLGRFNNVLDQLRVFQHVVAIGNEKQIGGVDLWFDLINHVEIAVIVQQHAASDSEAPVAVQHYYL